ncbi:TRAP transporter small permease [Azospirillum sp.]|uniref:TRAP transporter small permease n=1 Tax=Azospirillum sp. TaxID=34012 RepID=UPI003D71827F
MERALHRLETAALVIGALSCGLLTILTILDIGLRPLNVAFHVAGEMSGFLMAWLIFFSLATVSRTRQHIAADFFVSRFPPAVQRGFERVGDAAALLYVSALVYICGELTMTSLADDLRSQGILRTPIAIPQLGMMLGLALLWLRHAAFVFRHAKAPDPAPPHSLPVSAVGPKP